MASTRTLDRNFRPWADAWVEALAAAGLNPSITSARRTREEQTRLYNRFRSGASRYPAAPPGTSLHEWGLAVDIALPASVLSVLGPVWERLGMVWGGRFRDPIHFEAGPAVKKLAGYVKGAPYEPGIEPAFNPLEIFIPSKLVTSPITGAVSDWLTEIMR